MIQGKKSIDKINFFTESLLFCFYKFFFKIEIENKIIFKIFSFLKTIYLKSKSNIFKNENILIYLYSIYSIQYIFLKK